MLETPPEYIKHRIQPVLLTAVEKHNAREREKTMRLGIWEGEESVVNVNRMLRESRAKEVTFK